MGARQIRARREPVLLQRFLQGLRRRAARDALIVSGVRKSKDARTLDIREDGQLDEAQLAAWVKKADQLPTEWM